MFNLQPLNSTSSPSRLTSIRKPIVSLPGRNAAQACVSRSPWTPLQTLPSVCVYFESENTKIGFRKLEKEESMTGLSVHFGSRTPLHKTLGYAGRCHHTHPSRSSPPLLQRQTKIGNHENEKKEKRLNTKMRKIRKQRASSETQAMSSPKVASAKTSPRR